jgi:hypothetical protein
VNKTAGALPAAVIQAGVCSGSFATSLPDGTLTLENAGNTVLNVTLNFSGNASTIIGGGGGSIPLPGLYFTIAQNESGSCGTLNPSYADWTIIENTETVPSYMICTDLSPLDVSDSIAIGLKLSIPSNATQGSRILMIRAQGTS